MATKREKDGIYYSETIEGTSQNHDWSASFDFNDGYVGINQNPGSQDEVRVLLSPAQFKALEEFVHKGKHQR